MTTITLWILIATSMGYRPPVVIERFATADDCQRVLKQLDGRLGANAYCIEAKVARP